MEIYDLKGRVEKGDIVNFRDQLVKPMRIQGLKESSFDFLYDDGEVQFIPNSDNITEFDFSAWLPLTTSPNVNTIKGMYMSNRTVSLPNIVNIIIQDISVLSSISDWMFDTYAESGRDTLMRGTCKASDVKQGKCKGTGEKIISYAGKPVFSEVIIEGVVNVNITEINLPLNQNLNDLLKKNPQIASLGINADLFNYWNTIPQIDRIVIFASTAININIANYYLKSFQGEVLVIVW